VLVGGSFRRALRGRLLPVAERWPVCEVVAESWDPEDPADAALLERLASSTSVRLHSLSLNPLGDGPSEWAFARVTAWARRLRVESVSDHYAWTGAGDTQLGVFVPPIEPPEVRLDRVRELRDRLGLPLVLENIALPSGRDVARYHDELLETCTRAGVGVLLDLENLRLDGASARVPPAALADAYASVRIAGYHVAGSDVSPVVLDTHRHEVPAETLDLLRVAARRQPAPVIYERDFALDDEAIAREVGRIQSALEGT
jgi:uncharacterized protein (UPF0276 family)